MYSARGPRRVIRRALTRCRRTLGLFRVRPIWLRHNPLRRRSDRVEHAVVLAAFAVLLALLPVVVLIGSSAYRHGLATAALETAERRQVTAVLLQDARPSGGDQAADPGPVPVPARWEWPAGTTRTGPVPVAPGTRAGAQVLQWIDRAGRPADPPVTRADAARHSVANGVGAALLAFVSLVAALIAVLGVVRWRLDRTRLATWATEWSRIGPQWTRRYH